MPIKDPFSYTARWDSVGLDCSYCIHQTNDKEWPNLKRNYACELHNITLRVQLMESGYKNGEWFCSDFENNGKAHKEAIQEFIIVKPKLEANMLYGCYRKDGNLKEIPFKDLESFS